MKTISVIIPVYNEEENLLRLFYSLSLQSYPKSKIEYIVIDDGSTDHSNMLAMVHGAKVIKVNTKDIELNKGTGLYAAKGELVYWLDADMEICSTNFFELMAKPFVENEQIVGSFTKEFALDCIWPVENSLLRFMSYDPLQRDPLYQFFSSSIESSIIDEKSDYFICKFQPGRIPPAGRAMYRKKVLLSTAVGKDKSFIDMEALEIVTRAGHPLFSYVPKAKMRHYHAANLRQLIKKRLRNLHRDYLPNIETKYYVWFQSNSTKDILKLAFWIIYVNLIVGELVRGLIKAVRYRDAAFLWQPIVSVAVTDAILYGFLSKSSGRSLALKMVKTLRIKTLGK
jgi:glycosyltransferase involved in cell wall biosynthesis